MGLCDPCKEDAHDRHRGKETVEVRRKGLKMTSRTMDCECERCTKGPWRGEPQPVPPMPWGKRRGRRRG
jgi:hypothetical protein